VGGKTLAIVEAGARPVELSYELDTICHTDSTHPAARLHGHRRSTRARATCHAIAYHSGDPTSSTS